MSRIIPLGVSAAQERRSCRIKVHCGDCIKVETKRRIGRIFSGFNQSYEPHRISNAKSIQVDVNLLVQRRVCIIAYKSPAEAVSTHENIGISWIKRIDRVKNQVRTAVAARISKIVREFKVNKASR